MKKIIHKVNEKLGYFEVIVSDKIVYIYLTKRQRKQYNDYLVEGNFVEFTLKDKTKKINKINAHSLNYFITIERKTKRGTKVLYDLNVIRNNILEVLSNFNYYLFMDLEMTMPHYYKTPFEAEIIQVGYVLTNKNLEVIKKDNYYVTPTKYKKISKRTTNFLNITLDVFDNANEYSYFYEDLKKLINKYHPKIIVWGRNDVLAINKSYKLNDVRQLTKRNDFIDLLNIHKTYYQLDDDLGLFSAYEKYYGKMLNQEHDALDDAKVMMDVFKALRDLQ